MTNMTKQTEAISTERALKLALITEAAIQSKDHPSKDARVFAKAVHDYFMSEQPAHQHIEHCLWARNGNQPCPHVQPAQQQEPVAVVSGYYGGQCVILPIDPARIFNSGTVLYTSPQAQRKPLTDEQKDAARWRFLVDNSFDKEGVTQFHVWEHSWEPHSQTGEPTEWKQRVRGPALDRFIDRAIEAAHGIIGEQK